MMGNKYAKAYVYVVHATEQGRRDKYQGCVSRNVLRRKLRDDAFNGIRAQYPGEDRKRVKAMASAKSKREFRSIRGL